MSIKQAFVVVLIILVWVVRNRYECVTPDCTGLCYIWSSLEGHALRLASQPRKRAKKKALEMFLTPAATKNWQEETGKPLPSVPTMLY